MTTFIDELAHETLDWMAVDEPARPDMTDEVWGYALASVVDGRAITPNGYDETPLFDFSQQAATDGGLAVPESPAPSTDCADCGDRAEATVREDGDLVDLCDEHADERLAGAGGSR
mgnify:CR=1 FL=1